MIKKFLTLRQAVLYGKRALENYEFECRQKTSCTFRHIPLMIKILLIMQNSKKFNSKTLVQTKRYQLSF